MAPRKPVANARAAPHNSFITPQTTTKRKPNSVSIVGIFKRVPGKKAWTAQNIPQHRNSKMPHTGKQYFGTRKFPEHSLSIEFSDSTAPYATDLIEEARLKLEGVHIDFKTRLDNGAVGGTDASHSFDAAFIKTQRALEPLSKSTIVVAEFDPETNKKIKLKCNFAERMRQFAVDVEADRKAFQELQVEHDSVMDELKQLAVDMGFVDRASQPRKSGLSFASLQLKLEKEASAREMEVDGLGNHALEALEQQKKKDAQWKRKLQIFLAEEISKDY
ncbi:hypothetical protein EJ08DRAFT_165967 [Tothia fuscella]|uniref:Uncharacterized protein n=1 Tax=Tothia fuscella TaxID=1048955 RepID=A0A9P4NVD1_9PEZI|nr:hypothetical protein EJ08DRAFT_165967 [Tothia fuscella]